MRRFLRSLRRALKKIDAKGWQNIVTLVTKLVELVLVILHH
jgi:hypothetical protein